MAKVSSSSTRSPVAPFDRRRALAAVHAAAATLGLDTADKDPSSVYRTMVRVQGQEPVSSAASLSDAGLARLKLYICRQAAEAAKQQRSGPGGKVERLWAELGKAGKLRDPSAQGLRAFLQNRHGVSHSKWLTAAQASEVIEAFKAWLARR